MGLNVNLQKMFGIPDFQCPVCRKNLASTLKDFDIECYEPRNGILAYTDYCGNCDREFPIVITFTASVTVGPEKT